jgi:hypothetical protein
MRATLYITGAVLELGGILLVAAPDLLPYAERVSGWLRVETRRAVGRIRLALGRPRTQVIEVGGIASTSAVGNISLLVSPNPDATLEERVEYLLRREQEAQTKLNAHDERLRAIEEQLPRRLDELRAETEEHVATELSAAESRYRPLRFVGALLLAAGLGLTTAGNFL